jgi:hypothetical protein
MSGNFAACPTDALARFETIWQVDFEHREDANHHPIPVCMFAQEMRTGQTMFLWREQLLALRRAPFGTGPDDLMIAYAANAELSCFLALDWPFPYNVLDAYVETCAAINGRTDVWPPPKQEGEKRKGRRPGLIDALETVFGIPASISHAGKAVMRDLILSKEDYSEAERHAIERYNSGDVVDTIALFWQVLPALDLPHALHRGRYMAAVARQEWLGLPIDADCLGKFLADWDSLRQHYLDRDDEFGLYDEKGKFCEGRLLSLTTAKQWDWPMTKTGRLKTDAETFGKQARRYPELKRTAHMRNSIADLNIGNLANTIGADGFSRCPLMPFWTTTGRNQPQGRDKIFLPALPAWSRGLLRAPKGYTLIELDWDAQEIGIMAGLSGDPAMIEDYRSGDPHWNFGVRAGLVSPHADKRDHQALRDKSFKPVTLGTNYGMGPYGIAAKTGRSLLWARDIHVRHRRTYPRFHQWLGDTVVQAKFDRSISSPFGWPMTVIGNTGHRALMNFPAQSGGADAMRIVAIAATEAGIRVCCSVHDAFWILAPEGEEERTIGRMREIMMQAGAAVTGGLPLTVTVKASVTSAHNLGDSRKPGNKGYEMWAEVRELLAGGLRRLTG